MSEEIDRLAARLRPHYSHFLDRLGQTVLLTGHSHQAWPNASREGQIAAWEDAARLVDQKWEGVLGELVPELQRHIAKRIGSSRAKDLALGQNTHELVSRFMSCFDRVTRVLTTDSEFHSLERQLDRASEDGVEVVRVPAGDARDETFAERFIAEARAQRPTFAALSSVLFTTSRVIHDLPWILEELAKLDVPVVVDAYHAFNVLELSVDGWPGQVFVVGGGYKYAQCGEGVCFMLLPANAERYRPRNTGWFSSFQDLERDRRAKKDHVSFGEGGLRFFGATFDPTAFYRAVFVLRFMEYQGLTIDVLRRQSLLQTGMIIEAFDRHQLGERGIVLATPREAHRRGGFIALQHTRADQIQRALLDAGIRTDVRGDLLRLGPAPYLDSGSLRRALEVLDAVIARLS
jgi:selenocysteine lyase/cysteine desulfurase